MIASAISAITAIGDAERFEHVRVAHCAARPRQHLIGSDCASRILPRLRGDDRRGAVAHLDRVRSDDLPQALDDEAERSTAKVVALTARLHVAGSLCGSVVAKMNLTSVRGSSSVFSRRVKALLEEHMHFVDERS